jgi:hypothetical protein
MAIKLLMVGSDMEVFLRDNLSGVPVPVCGLIGGTKEKPKEVLGGNGFAVQEDNVMLEFTFLRPTRPISFRPISSKFWLILRRK